MEDHTSIFSVLENPMDRGAWWATVHGVTNSWTWLNDFHFQYDSLIPIWRGSYSDSPRQALSVLYLSLLSLGWVSYSWYFISVKVTSLQGENGAGICQVSWLWDCNWEIPPSVHLLPRNVFRLMPMVAANGLISKTVGVYFFGAWCHSSKWASFLVQLPGGFLLWSLFSRTLAFLWCGQRVILFPDASSEKGWLFFSPEEAYSKNCSILRTRFLELLF